MNKLINSPEIKLGIVGVSRDCFPATLTEKRLNDVMSQLESTSLDAVKCSVIIENEIDALNALKELESKGCNAAVIYLGNFGPEGPTTIFASRFGGPVMVCAAAEENKTVLASDRGDALCGMLNCSYNLNLRAVPAYIPPQPVGLPHQIKEKILNFEPIARIINGLQSLKIFAFGPRPHDFYACNAPIQPLYDLGIEVMENSELDLLQRYQQAGKNKDRIKEVAQDMSKELGKGATYPDLLNKLAQFEITLLDFMAENLGASQYGIFADKCWPGFESAFGFVPCYINSRLAGRGIPVACEVDIYGSLSEYMVQLAGMHPATLLDINNSVPEEIIPSGFDLKGAAPGDLFMGFHCGNTCSSCMKNCKMNYQVIMNRLMEDGKTPDITRGTLEGQLLPGPMTMFRLQSTSDGELLSYIANGNFLDIDPHTFGGTGVIAIPDFARFYRYALIGRNFPHHAAIGFKQLGKTLFDTVKLLGVDEISTPLPKGVLYENESPFI